MINKFLPIKKAVVFCIALLTTLLMSNAGFSQALITEQFNYTPDAALGLYTQSSATWTRVNSGDSILVAAGNLSYSGLTASAGNKVTYGGIGADYSRGFTSQTTGTVYCSFLLKVTSIGTLNTTGGYTVALTDATTGFASTIWIRLSGTSDFNIGLNPRTTGANTTWLSNTLTLNTTYLVVLSLEAVSGLANDVSKIWLNPTSLGGTEPTADASATNTTGTDLLTIQRVLLRQPGNATEAPAALEIDEMRVGTTWADVTPSGAATAPGAPSITSIAPGDGQLTVNFTTPSSDGGSTITNYQYSTDNGASFTACAPVQTTSPIVITGLTNGTQYSVIIQAINAINPGTSSNMVTGTPVAVSVPTITASTLPSFGDVCVGLLPGLNTFTISGAALTTADITVGPLTGYSFSNALGGTYTSTFTITQSGGTLADTTIFVKFTPASAISYDGDIPVAGGGATTVNVAATGSGINTPATATTGSSSSITSSAATIAGSYTQGCASVSAYGIVYSQTNGFDPSITGSAIPSVNQVSGSFSVGLTSLTASTTYYYVAYATTVDGTVYGSQSSFTTLAVGPPTASVIAAWDFNTLSSIATLAATTFDANLVSTSALSEITRGAAAAASAGANSFRTVGFKNEGIATTNTDYFQTTLQTAAGYSLSLSSINAKFAGTASFYAAPGVTSQYAYSLDGTTFTLIGTPSTSTSLTLSVDVTGVADLQNVPSGTTVYIRYYASGQTTTGGWGFVSSTPGSNGLEYTGFIDVEVVGPKIVATPKTLAFGDVVMLTNSTSQSFNIEGTNLSGFPDNITITAPADYQVSTDDINWSTSITIPYTSATLSSTPVYVRFTPQVMGANSADVTITGGGVVLTVKVAVSGNGITNAALTTTNLTGFDNVCVNTVAGPYSFVIDAVNLDNTAIVVGPLAGFSFSATSNGTYTSTLNIPQTGGASSQTVFVQFSPTAEVTYSGDIPVVGGGIPNTIYVSVTGVGTSGGGVIVTGDTLSVSPNAAYLLGEIANEGCSPVTSYGIEYSGMNGFIGGYGTRVPSNNINSSSIFSSHLTGLIQNTTYYYRAYAINGSSITYGDQKQFFTSPISAGLVVYATPIVRGGDVHFTLSGIKPGHYFVRLINIAGQRVFQKDLIVPVDFIDDHFTMPAKLPIGVYTFQVLNLDFTIIKQIIVQ